MEKSSERTINNKLTMLLKSPVFKFIPALQKAYPKSKVYLVGGMVRDIFLKRESKDYDFVISGVPAKKLESFLRTHGTVNLVGKRFGVYKFVPKRRDAPQMRGVSTELDIALPRTDHAWGTGGYRDVETQSDYRLPIEQDLARRDFTINAIAIQLTTNNKQLTTVETVIDPFGGLRDCQHKLIRAVGNPKERFQEDYSRMLRALRFACQLNFSIEEKTWSAIAAMIKKINDLDNKKEHVVAREIIAKELLKSFMAHPIKTLELWDKAGAIKYLMPELLKMKKCPQPLQFHAEGDVWEHAKIALKNLLTPEFKKFAKKLPGHLKDAPLYTPELILGVLFHDSGKPYTLKTPEKDGVDRIRTDGHDTYGAKLMKKVSHRLKLMAVPYLLFSPDKAAWLVQHHLLVIHGDPMKFTHRTIERYFFSPAVPGADLLKLMYCDQMASYVGGAPQLGSLTLLIKRIAQLIRHFKRKKSKLELPPPLLNGDEIMKLMKLKPGPRVGEVKDKLREAQLAGKIGTKSEAGQFLLEYQNPNDKCQINVKTQSSNFDI